MNSRETPSRRFHSLLQDVERAPQRTFTRYGHYKFDLFSIGERGTEVTKGVREDAIEGLQVQIGESGIDYDIIVTIEPGGLPWALSLLVKTGWKQPLRIIRLRASYRRQELMKEQTSNYYQRKLYFCSNKLPQGARAIFVDDVVSSTETCRVVHEIMNECGIALKGIFAVVVKGTEYEKFSKETGVPVFGVVQKLASGKAIECISKNENLSGI